MKQFGTVPKGDALVASAGQQMCMGGPFQRKEPIAVSFNAAHSFRMGRPPEEKFPVFRPRRP